MQRSKEYRAVTRNGMGYETEDDRDDSGEEEEEIEDAKDRIKFLSVS
jgi:hypothetical protein